MQSMASEFYPAARVDEIPVGDCQRVNLEGERIAIFNVAGTFYATNDTCTHDEASLCAGELDGHVIECPKHGARFDVITGRALSLPAVVPVEVYEVRVENGQILVGLDF